MTFLKRLFGFSWCTLMYSLYDGIGHAYGFDNKSQHYENVIERYARKNHLEIFGKKNVVESDKDLNSFYVFLKGNFFSLKSFQFQVGRYFKKSGIKYEFFK